MKQILTFLVMFMLMMGTVIAPPPVPQPVRGFLELNGQSLAGYVIEITNLRTGETVSGIDKPSLVTEPAGFSFDLSFFKEGYISKSAVYVGDTIRINAVALSDPQSSIDVIFDPEIAFPEVRISMVNQQTIFVCPDGSNVVNSADCPVEEEPEPEEPEDVVEIETKVVSVGDDAIVEADYGQPIEIVLTDSKVSNLLDLELDYDGEDYDIHEEVYFKGIVLTSLDDEDYELNPYLNILEGDVEYRYVFEDEIPYDDIHLEEALEITFLGKELKIIEAGASELVIRSGTEYSKKEGDGFKVLGRDVVILAVGENSVSVEVGGVAETVNDGEDRDINGLRVLVESIIYNGYEGGTKLVDLVIGIETDEVVKDGDDFELFVEDAEDYKWVINLPDYIGIISQEDYISIDEDEEYMPLGVGDSLALPNDYLVFTFEGVSEEEMTDLTFKVKDGFLNVKGDSNSDTFVFGSDEYDEIRVSEEGIFDDDEELITTDKVRIGDSDTFLELGSVKIGKLTILLDMSDILYDGISYAFEETDFLDYLGMVFRDPENAVEDQTGFKVSVPEERPEITLLISSEVPSVPVVEPEAPVDEEGDTGVVTPPNDTTTTPVLPPITKYICSDGSEVSDKSNCPVEDEDKVVPPVEPESDLKTILITMIASIIGVFTWGKGFAGLIKYYLRLAEETNDRTLAKKYKDRAEKMAKTVVFNFLAGKYKKEK